MAHKLLEDPLLSATASRGIHTEPPRALTEPLHCRGNSVAHLEKMVVREGAAGAAGRGHGPSTPQIPGVRLVFWRDPDFHGTGRSEI